MDDRISIEKIKKQPKFFKGFVLFLDEFVSSKWATYIRNLARSIGLTCLVANTNTRVANLVGTESCSGSTDLRIWSIVITSLGPTNIRFLNSQFHLSDVITKIKKKSTDPGVALYLDNFVNEEIKYLSPGMAYFMAVSIVEFEKKYKVEKITLKIFLDHVLNYVARLLMFRKLDDRSDLPSQCAKIGLLLSESFEKSPPKNDDYSWFCSGFSFLQNHLYHLADPSNSGNWIILTCPPQKPSNQLRFIITAGLLPWTNERTFFNQGETSTILACMFLAFGNTVTDILTRSKSIIGQNALNVSDSQNEKAVQRKGNLLEVSASISIIDSSQHCTNMKNNKFNYDSFTLEGQNGISFINNLLINLLNIPCGYKGNFRFQLSFNPSTYNLQNFLKTLKVPFLYSLNREDEFLDELDKVSNSIYLKTFENTPNSEQVDGKFEIKCGKQIKFAVVECKNLKKKIPSTILKQIITKCVRIDNSKLFLVFCDQIVSSQSTKRTLFTKTCDDKKSTFIESKNLKKISTLSPIMKNMLRLNIFASYLNLL